MNTLRDRLTLLETRLDTTVWSYGRDEPVDLDAIEALLAEVAAVAPLLDLDQKKRLHRRMQLLQTAAAEARLRLGDRLGNLGAGRRALHGYASLVRPEPRGRLRRRA